MGIVISGSMEKTAMLLSGTSATSQSKKGNMEASRNTELFRQDFDADQLLVERSLSTKARHHSEDVDKLLYWVHYLLEQYRTTVQITRYSGPID